MTDRDKIVLAVVLAFVSLCFTAMVVVGELADAGAFK